MPVLFYICWIPSPIAEQVDELPNMLNGTWGGWPRDLIGMKRPSLPQENMQKNGAKIRWLVDFEYKELRLC